MIPSLYLSLQMGIYETIEAVHGPSRHASPPSHESDYRPVGADGHEKRQPRIRPGFRPRLSAFEPRNTRPRPSEHLPT